VSQCEGCRPFYGDASPAAPTVAVRLTSPPRVTETTVSGTGGAGQELSLDDYLVGGVTMFDAQTGLPPISELDYLIPLCQVILPL
jgi:hypothetical protein